MSHCQPDANYQYSERHVFENFSRNIYMRSFKNFVVISLAIDCVLAVVIAVNASVRRVITTDHRLTERSFL